MSLLANSNAIESGGYPIQRSLRFRSSASAYLNRTFTTPTSSTIFTWSGWVKRGTLGATGYLFGASTTTNFGFNSSNQLLLTLNGTAAVTTTAVYRDPSSWYHVLYNQNGSAQTVYVNNVSVGTGTTANTVFNTAIAHQIAAANTTNYFDGYLAEVNFIDGQALTPSSFGYTEPLTGVWQPLKYTGTYGTNGFYLPFIDNTSATTLAYDKSGNSNNWTPNNISTTAGATYDSMTDVPTLTSATAANFAVLNRAMPTGVTNTISDGGLSTIPSVTGSYYQVAVQSIIPTTGKWYAEFKMGYDSTGKGFALYTTNSPLLTNGAMPGTDAGGTSWMYSGYYGTMYYQNASTAYGSTYTTGDVIGIALDLDNQAVYFSKNGVWQNSGVPTSGASKTGAAITTLVAGTEYYFGPVGTASTAWTANFGQRPFSYTPPTGFKALNTFNLPDPTIKKPNQYMDATTYTGNGGTQTITNAGSMQPDLVWIKSRSNATYHNLFDSVRGATKVLFSNDTLAEVTNRSDNLTSFNANGFSLGADVDVNGSTRTMVGWQWKKGATPGFDIVTYTGNGSNRTISHSLGVAPSMMIVKSRSQGTTGYTGNWAVWHSAIANTEYLLLNTTAAKATGATYWNSTTPTSSVFSLGTAAVVNNNNDNFVNYLFAEIAGFSKFGSYTGNGSADGPFVYCGFRPKFVMWKCSSTGGAGYDWFMYDSSRDNANGYGTHELYADLSNAEGQWSAGTGVDFTSNGFKIRNTSLVNNGSGYTYIFCAFAENPFKYSLAR